MSNAEDSDQDIANTLGNNWGAGLARCYLLNADAVRNENILRLMPIPDSFICPISCNVMQVPVATVDGCIYDRQFIMQWIRERRSLRQIVTSPSTGLELPSTQVVPLVALQRAIETYMDHRPELRDLCSINYSLETSAQLLQSELLEKQVLYQSTQDHHRSQEDATRRMQQAFDVQQDEAVRRQEEIQEEMRALRENLEESQMINQILREELSEVREEYSKNKNELDDVKSELCVIKAVHSCLPVEVLKVAAQKMTDNAILDGASEPEADIKDVDLVIAQTRPQRSDALDLLTVADYGLTEVLEPDQEPNSDEDAWSRKIRPADLDKDKEEEEEEEEEDGSPKALGQENKPLLDDEDEERRRERNKAKKQKKKQKHRAQSHEERLTSPNRPSLVDESADNAALAEDCPTPSSSSSSVPTRPSASSAVVKKRPLMNILSAACSRRPGGGEFLKKAMSKTVSTMKEMVVDVELEYGSKGLEVKCRFGLDKDKDKDKDKDQGEQPECRSTDGSVDVQTTPARGASASSDPFD